MKYRNAREMLPEPLLQDIQQHVQGELLYIPKAQRAAWGSGTGAKSFYATRNASIRKEFSHGATPTDLGGTFFLTEDAVKKIVYKKGDENMNANEMNYSKYYWQNDLVRVRRAKAEDWKHNFDKIIDSNERFFVDYEQELPWDEETRRTNWENYVNANKSGENHIIFIFEAHSGEYVGGGNLHGINTRNGTFGMFVYGDDDKYVIAGAQLLLNYAFNELRLNNCTTGFIEEDDIFQPVFVKLGFHHDGMRRQQVFHKGKYLNENFYSLLASEFNAK